MFLVCNFSMCERSRNYRRCVCVCKGAGGVLAVLLFFCVLIAAEVGETEPMFNKPGEPART